MPWECFWIERARPATEWVVGCPNKHRTVIETAEVGFDEAPNAPSDGWPERCPECDVPLLYAAEGMDTGWKTKIGGWMWRRPDTGEEHRNQHEFGAGAMYDCTDWSPEDWRGPDGRSLAVVLPPGGMSDFWHIDGPASSGGFWTRTGDAPKITVTPSILTPNYHGFLRDGVLTDSLPDRPLP